MTVLNTEYRSSAPEGRPRVARRVSAGFGGGTWFEPRRGGRRMRRQQRRADVSVVPPGLRPISRPNPALTRRATLGRPSRAEDRKHYVLCPHPGRQEALEELRGERPVVG